jgi:hypothetical protein
MAETQIPFGNDKQESGFKRAGCDHGRFGIADCGMRTKRIDLRFQV